MRTFSPTPRTTLGRRRERGRYDHETVYSILDEAPYCHVGFLNGRRPAVIPTIHARDGDVLYLHGSTGSRTLRTLRDGAEACVVATILDGLVLARSAAHHSMNYRSVVVYGIATEIRDPAAKLRAMRAVVEHLLPDRWGSARRPSPREIAATMILALPLDEASAKVRTGGPIEEEEDVVLPFWGGVIPVRLEFGAPQPDEHVPPGALPPAPVR